MKDYELVTVRFHTATTVLLSGTAYIVGSTEIIGFPNDTRAESPYLPAGSQTNSSLSCI